MAKDDFTIQESLLDIVLDKDFDFEGSLYFSKSMLVKGKIKGTINSTGHIIIAKEAVINADISAAIVSNYGLINGNIVASERVELLGKAEVKGNVTTPSIYIDNGSIYNGTCLMKSSNKGKL